MDESHELVDSSINESISKRILAVYLDEPYYYYLGYEAILLDLDKHLIITNDARGIKDTPKKILIFNVSSFIIIDKETNNIQVYFNENIAAKKVRDSLVTMMKHTYGDYLTFLNNIDEISDSERTILLQLRDNYATKNK